ncbi:MAG: replicative DNA helicase [Erysipelotrichaceae bacterium]|nr:replicative DNA helicase [Erysipelotrichaceae bacterium]
MTQKLIPFSNEAEVSLLGNFILWPDTLQDALEEGLLSTDFYLERNRLIFTTIVEMKSSGLPYEITSLNQRLKDYGLLDKIGGINYLVELQSAAVGSNATKHYVKIIRDKAINRNLIDFAKTIENQSYDGSQTVDELLDDAERGILNITRNRFVRDFSDSVEVIDRVIDNVRALSDGNIATGVKCAYRDLDEKTNGFQRGDLIILAARPSVGKTAFAINVALNIAGIDNGQLGAVAIFSLEMSSEQLFSRMLSARSRVKGEKIRTGRLNNDDWSRLITASNRLKKEKLFIDDTPAIKISEIYSKCRKLRNKEGLACVVIDYIQLIGTNGNRGESRQQEVSEISRALKALARELEVPVIALSQLSRSVEKRDDKRPMLSDLRESGALEQDADIVMFLYRDEYYSKEKEESNVQEVEVTIAKHRNGPTGRITLAFHKDVNAFLTIDRRLGDGQ